MKKLTSKEKQQIKLIQFKKMVELLSNDEELSNLKNIDTNKLNERIIELKG